MPRPSWDLAGGGAGISRGHLKFGESLSALSKETTAQQTGTGANQEIEHDLGAEPGTVVVIAQGLADYPGPFTVSVVSKDKDKITVNATAGLKFQLLLSAV